MGCYLGRSICSLADVVAGRGLEVDIVGVDTALGSGPEGKRNTNAHGHAVQHGGGTMAGLLHRNVLACGFADRVQLIISDSVRASRLFPDDSVAWVHLDARHDYASVCEDIDAWRDRQEARFLFHFWQFYPSFRDNFDLRCLLLAGLGEIDRHSNL